MLWCPLYAVVIALFCRVFETTTLFCVSSFLLYGAIQGRQANTYIALRGVGEGEYLPKYYMLTEGVSQANAYVSQVLHNGPCE